MTAKIVSNIKKITHPSERIFNFLSDFEKLSPILEKAIQSSEVQEHDINDKIKTVHIEHDKCTIEIDNYGAIDIEIINREPHKTIKYSSGNDTPFPFLFWIQLKELTSDDTRIRLTLHAKMNTMMKMMSKKHLKKAIDQLAEALTKIPY